MYLLAEALIEPFRIGLVFKRRYEVIRETDQARFATTVSFNDFLKPQIRGVVQVHIGETIPP